MVYLGFIFLSRDHLVVPGRVVKSGKDKIKLNLTETSQFPKGEVGNLVNRLIASTVPSTRGVILADR